MLLMSSSILSCSFSKLQWLSMMFFSVDVLVVTVTDGAVTVTVDVVTLVAF